MSEPVSSGAPATQEACPHCGHPPHGENWPKGMCHVSIPCSRETCPLPPRTAWHQHGHSCGCLGVAFGAPPAGLTVERLAALLSDREFLQSRRASFEAQAAWLLPRLGVSLGSPTPAMIELPLYVYHGPPEGMKLLVFPELPVERPVVLTPGDRLELRWVRAALTAPEP